MLGGAAAGDVDELHLERLVRLPQLAIVHRVDRLPEARLAAALGPSRARDDGRRPAASAVRATTARGTPLVMWPIGTCSSLVRRTTAVHIARDTWPCSDDTALARCD